MLDQLSGEFYKLERKAVVFDEGPHDMWDESKPDEQDTNERARDHLNKEPDCAIRGEDEDDPKGPLVKSVRQESRGESEGRDDLRDGPLKRGQNQEVNAGGSSEDNPRRKHASASVSNHPGRRGEPLDDHTNKGRELQGKVPAEQPSPPEQAASQRSLPKSPAGNGKARNEEPAAGESAQLRSDLREARSLAEKFRGELSAAQQM